MPIWLVILRRKALCNTLNWGYWNSGFVKLGVRWAECGITLELLSKLYYIWFSWTQIVVNSKIVEPFSFLFRNESKNWSAACNTVWSQLVLKDSSVVAGFTIAKKKGLSWAPRRKWFSDDNLVMRKKMSLVLPFSISLFWYFLATLDKFQLLKLVNHSQSSSLVGKTSQTIVVFKECELLIECLDSGQNSLSHTFINEPTKKHHWSLFDKK